MGTNSSARYRKAKKGYKKRLPKCIKIFLRKKKKQKWQCGSKRYKSFPEDEKQRLIEYIYFLNVEKRFTISRSYITFLQYFV